MSSSKKSFRNTSRNFFFNKLWEKNIFSKIPLEISSIVPPEISLEIEESLKNTLMNMGDISARILKEFKKKTSEVLAEISEIFVPFDHNKDSLVQGLSAFLSRGVLLEMKLLRGASIIHHFSV